MYIQSCLLFVFRFGLQRQSNSEASRAVLKSIIPRIVSCREVLHATTVSNALFGLQKHGDSEESRSILRVLAPRITSCKETINAQQLACAFYGLQRFGDSEEVRCVFRALVPKLKECRDPFTSQSLSHSFMGIFSQGASDEVRAVIRALARKIAECQERIEPHALASSLASLRGQTDCDEVRSLVWAITPKIDECEEFFVVDQVAAMLRGIRGLPDIPEVVKLVTAVLEHLDTPVGEQNERHILQCMLDLNAFRSAGFAKAETIMQSSLEKAQNVKLSGQQSKMQQQIAQPPTAIADAAADDTPVSAGTPSHQLLERLEKAMPTNVLRTSSDMAMANNDPSPSTALRGFSALSSEDPRQPQHLGPIGS